MEDTELRRAVRAMTAMLQNGEWAEHVSKDLDAVALESAITELHNELHTAEDAAAPAPVAQAAVGADGEEFENGVNAWLDNQHPDDAAVDSFAGKMRSKMAAARAKGRGGWQDKVDCPAERLSAMLRAHVEKGDPVDVANFCMMLAQRGEPIAPARYDRIASEAEQMASLREDFRLMAEQRDHWLSRRTYWRNRAEKAEAALAATPPLQEEQPSTLAPVAGEVAGGDALDDAAMLDWLDALPGHVERRGRLWSVIEADGRTGHRIGSCLDTKMTLRDAVRTEMHARNGGGNV